MAKYDNRGFITQLDENEIFVFGSNGDGAHWGGAARTAVDNFGAIMGQAEGLQGQSYAINTMGAKEEMAAQVARFLQFAKSHPELKFLVTEIGCGIAGYRPEEVAPYFIAHTDNVVLPESFSEVLGEMGELSYSIRDRARGMLVGLAIGDALGAPYEFGYTSSKIVELGDEIAHFRDHRIPKGVWTDDTEMALCLADSILENGGYDSYDVMEKYSRWMNEGYRTYDGLPASDVGYQTRRAIVNFKRDPEYLEETDSAGNGAIMRLAPVIIACLDKRSFIDTGKLAHIQELARISCRDTHNSKTAINITDIFACIMGLHFTGAPYYSMNMSTLLEHAREYCGPHGEVYDHIYEILHGSNSKDGEELKNLGGYILDALNIALWGVMYSRSFEEGLLKVIRLGGDTDTNAAIYGQLAGATYGYDAIPKEWKDGVYGHDELVKIADDLLAMKSCPIIRTRFSARSNDAAASDLNQPQSIGDILEEMKDKKRDMSGTLD